MLTSETPWILSLHASSHNLDSQKVGFINTFITRAIKILNKNMLRMSYITCHNSSRNGYSKKQFNMMVLKGSQTPIKKTRRGR